MGMRAATLAILVLAALSACNKKDDTILFDGQIFRAQAAKADKDLSVFMVAVSPVSASLLGAREAGRYQGTRYCIQNYGTSKILWTVGPDTDPETLLVEKDTVVFQGVCKP